MPELPEVEAARRAIEEHCLGKKIKRSIVADDAKVIDGISPSDFEASLVGKTIVSAHRKGKNMWLQLDSPPFPSFQFGMAGAIYIKGVAVTKYKRSAVNDADEWPSKYSKLFIELDDGLELSFTDKRRFAKVRLLKDPISTPPISELGPDALLEPMTVDEFFNSLSKKKIAIKTLLLDQSYISGIGNWIADEVLYQARIHPLQIAAILSKENCATLSTCIKEVIERAIEVGADSTHFPSNWIFHSREKKPDKAFVDGVFPYCPQPPHKELLDRLIDDTALDRSLAYLLGYKQLNLRLRQTGSKGSASSTKAPVVIDSTEEDRKESDSDSASEYIPNSEMANIGDDYVEAGIQRSKMERQAQLDAKFSKMRKVCAGGKGKVGAGSSGMVSLCVTSDDTALMAPPLPTASRGRVYKTPSYFDVDR